MLTTFPDHTFTTVNAPLLALICSSKPLTRVHEIIDDDDNTTQCLLYNTDVQVYHDTNEVKHRLTSNVPRGQSIGLSVQSLLQRYRGAYPTDPVSDREFEKLIGELHPNAVLAERSHTPLTGSAQNGSGFGATHKHPRSTHHNQAEGSEHELAHSIESHPDGVFAEFVSRWKSVRPGNGNARAKDETIKRSLPRKLDVLSWGFNE